MASYGILWLWWGYAWLLLMFLTATVVGDAFITDRAFQVGFPLGNIFGWAML